MPHRTPRLVWAGRAVALAAVAGLAVYLFAVSPARAAAVAVPAGVVIALAGLLAPYLLPAYQPPAPTPGSAQTGPPSPGGGVVIIADRGSVAAQRIGQVTMNAPPADPPAEGGEAPGQ